jgi:transposase InsO family protein
VGAFGCFGDQKETLPVTPDQIIHARRAHVLDQAALTTVTEACRAAGVSRTSYYRWVAKAEKYGLSALMPKDRRPPVMPNAMTAEEVSTILATAVARATLGARQLVDHVATAGVHRSASGIQKVLRRHNLGTRRQRIAALASLTAAESGQLTDAALEGPFGFCLAATDPGQLVCLDTFYVGRLKGVGAVYQLTAIDVATRWLVVRLIVGDKSARVAAGFLDQVQAALGEIDVELAGVLTDNGPEFTGRAFRDHLAEIEISHHRIPPRSPNHNSVCERVQGTVLQEFYRPFFHRGRVDRIADLDAALQTWTADYNTRRRNHGDYMRGRSPRQVLDAIIARNALCQAA